MSIQAITVQQLARALGGAARTLTLGPGSELAARVLEAPNPAGMGAISLAGVRLPARLPAEVQPGQELRLVVVRAAGGELVARVKHETGADPARLQELAGQLALSGDGDLLRAAVGLAQGGPLWLPEGRAAELALDPDQAGAGRDEAGAGEAAFVLHCPRLGAIEVRLRVAPGAVTAGVVTPPGAGALAESSLDELVDGLRRATGRPAAASVRVRPDEQPPPRPPAGRVDARA
jgi:hypothetical protein